MEMTIQEYVDFQKNPQPLVAIGFLAVYELKCEDCGETQTYEKSDSISCTQGYAEQVNSGEAEKIDK